MPEAKTAEEGVDYVARLKPAVDVDELTAELPKYATEQQLSPEARQNIELRIDNALTTLNEVVEAYLDGAAHRATQLERIADDAETFLRGVTSGTALQPEIDSIVGQIRTLAERSRVEPDQPKQLDSTEAKLLLDAKDGLAVGPGAESIKNQLTNARTFNELEQAWDKVHGALVEVRSKTIYMDTVMSATENNLGNRVSSVLEHAPSYVQGEALGRVDRIMKDLSEGELRRIGHLAATSRDELVTEVMQVIGEIDRVVGAISQEQFRR